jgi:hypothetical protein
MAAEIPATSEIILQTDASKQFLDTLRGTHAGNVFRLQLCVSLNITMDDTWQP